MLLNKWWVSLNFFFHCRSSLAWTQKEPEACMCIRCRQKEGGTQWARSPACLFLLVFLLSFLILTHPSPPHIPTPTPHPHPGVMEAKPWGKGPSLSHNNLWSQEHMENPSGFCSLSVVSLLGTEGSHSCRNAQQSKYTKVHLSGPRTRGTVPVSWKMV